MKYVNNLICAILLLTFISCTETEKINIPSAKIDFTDITHINQTEGSIVNLETSDSSLLYDICSFNVIRDTLVIHSRNFLRMFSQDGKFLGNISQIGSGPNEYTRISNVFFENNRVGIFENNKNSVSWFNLRGELSASEKIKIDNENIRPFHLYPFEKGYIALNSYGGESADRKTLCFLNKELTQGIPIKGRSLRTGFSTYDNIFIDSKGEVIYWEMLCDTLFTVKDSILTPSLVIDFGKYGIPKDIARKDVYERINYVNQLGKHGDKFAGMARCFQRIGNMLYFSCMSPDKKILLCQYHEYKGIVRLFSVDFDNQKYELSSFFFIKDNFAYCEIHNKKDLTLNPSLFIFNLNCLK